MSAPPYRAAPIDALFQREDTAKQVPRSARHDLDRGDDGAPSDYPDHHLIVPFKRRRNHRVLNLAERQFNRAQARRRILVEHVFSRLKKYQVLAQVSRHRISDDTRRFRNVAALTNFRLAPTMA